MGEINKNFIMLYVLILVLFFAGCAKKEKEVIRIGVSVSNFEDRFLSYLKRDMEEYQKSMSDNVQVTYLDAKMDEEKQENQVEYFIENGIDAVIVLPVDAKRTSKMTEMVKKAKIPIIYGNNYPDQFREKELPAGVYFVGSKEKTAGIIQMKYLAEKLNGKGDVAVLMGDFSNQATFDRTEGVEETADKYPGINIVEKESGKWLRPLAASIVEGWMSSGMKIDAIVANNDEMAIGAIRALEKYGKTDEVMVVGVDATEDAVAELGKGLLAATVFQDSYSQGKKLLDVAFKAARGEKTESETWIPFKLVTPETYKEVIKNR